MGLKKKVLKVFRGEWVVGVEVRCGLIWVRVFCFWEFVFIVGRLVKYAWKIGKWVSVSLVVRVGE